MYSIASHHAVRISPEDFLLRVVLVGLDEPVELPFDDDEKVGVLLVLRVENEHAKELFMELFPFHRQFAIGLDFTSPFARKDFAIQDFNELRILCEHCVAHKEQNHGEHRQEQDFVESHFILQNSEVSLLAQFHMHGYKYYPLAIHRNPGSFFDK